LGTSSLQKQPGVAAHAFADGWRLERTLGVQQRRRVVAAKSWVSLAV
jgi:hypothetical protein